LTTLRPKHLSIQDLKILETLENYGPRNITKIARILGMPAETLRKRLKRLRSQNFFRTSVNIYHTNLGLKKAVVFAEAIPGYEDLLLECLKQNGFWIFLSRCYGMFEGCVGIYTIPKEHSNEFEQFLDEIKNLGVSENIEIFWSTCFHSVHSRCNWFNEEIGHWSFEWEKWLVEIHNEQINLPYTLVEPKDFPILGDKADILMLKELEKDATIKIVNLAKMLEISPQLARYHFNKHIFRKGLIEDFDVTVFHFGREQSDFHFFIFNFQNYEMFAKFASSLLDKPFVRALGKILGKNSLYAYIYLPRTEFRKFLKVLSNLVKSGVLESYFYVIQDLENSYRQTIPYEYFDNGLWIYNFKKHIENLHDIVKTAKMGR